MKMLNMVTNWAGPRLLLVTMSLAFLGAQVNQPPATPNPTNTQGSAGPSGSPNDVFKAKNVREVATISCTTAVDDPCLNRARPAIDEIAGRFNGTLIGADGKDSSPLAQAVKDFLAAPIAAPDGSTTVWSAAAPYALLHVVQFSANNSVHDKWVLAHRKGKVTEVSDSLHILGAKTIAVIFVHLNASVTMKAGETNPTRQETLATYDDVSYRAIVEPKLPINIQNLLALLKIATGNLQAEGAVAKPVSLVGFGVMQRVDVPSDVTVFGAHVNSSSLIGQTQQYDNEGKYWWDASVAVPVNKLSLLDYSSDGVYTPKQINKQSIYALLNIYPDAVDLKYGSKRWVLPRAVGGIGLTGRPGENFMVGGAWGIQQLQFFVGSGFANHKVLLPGADPKIGTSYVQRYASHLTYGINVPVLSAIKKMTSSNSAAKTGGK